MGGVQGKSGGWLVPKEKRAVTGAWDNGPKEQQEWERQKLRQPWDKTEKKYQASVSKGRQSRRNQLLAARIRLMGERGKRRIE